MVDWVIETGVAVSLLIILVLIVRRPFARMFGARAAYALWLLPFIRLMMPEVTIPRIFPSLARPAPEIGLPAELVMTPEMITAMQSPSSLMSQFEPYILPTLFALWAFGAVFFFFYHWLCQSSLMDRLTYASEPATQLRPAIASAAQAAGLKRIPQVRISDENDGPLVAGFFNPIIILPDNFMTAFSPQQRHYALMHEFMHIKRGDIWIALAWLGFRAINWPNPLVHYAAKHFRSDQEAACDASVLNVMGNCQNAVTGYAETLIHAAKTAITDGRASPTPSQLALTIHHPLKERLMILGTHRKTSNWRSRTAAAVMIIGAATLSAPLIQADAHPEEELAGKYQPHQGKSVIKRKLKVDGKTVSEHFEINVNDDKIEAFKIGPQGEKTPISLDDIEGVDVADILSETFEGHEDGMHMNSRKITISDGEGLKVMSREDFEKWAEKEYPEWKEKDFSKWAEGDFKTWTGKVEFHSKDGKNFELKNFPKVPKPPFPPGLSKDSRNVFVLKNHDIKGLEKLEALEGLEGLEKLEALKHLKNLGDTESFTFFSDGGDEMNIKMRLTESRLAAARAMLEGTAAELEGNSREMAKAKRELEKARKALQAAEKALKEAE